MSYKHDNQAGTYMHVDIHIRLLFIYGAVQGLYTGYEAKLKGLSPMHLLTLAIKPIYVCS